MPEHFRVTEIRPADIQHGIPRVFRPGAPVLADGQMLGLPLWPCVQFGGVARVYRDDTRHAWLAQAARIRPIDHRAAGENHYVIALGNGHGSLFPPDQVAAYRVPPAHMTP